MSRNPVVIGLAFLGGFFLFLLLLIIIALFFLVRGKPALPVGEKIGVIEIVGVISSADEVIKDLRQFLNDDSIKAIIVRIDSPGGAVGASQEIYQALKQARQKKPVIASMESVAASGGLYVTLGASRILAMPGTLTGSIGVMMQVPNIKGLLDKVGVKAQVLKSGPYKDAGSIFRPLKEEEKKVLMGTINDIYQQFIEAISESRHIPLAKVKTFADGRVFTGRQAKKYGLIDELGNFERAIEIAASLGGIKGKPHLVYPEREKPWLKWLLGEDFKGQAFSLWFAPLYLTQFAR